MIQRRISEVTVREALARASLIGADAVEGRFVVKVPRGGRWWVIILEPDEERECVVVVTVYSERGP